MVFSSDWFARHQRTLLVLLNMPFVGQLLRRALWVQDMWRPVVKITPNAAHYWAGQQRRRADISSGEDHAEGLRASFYWFWSLLHIWDMRIANRLAPTLNLGFDTLDEPSAAQNAMIAGASTAYAPARSTATSHFNNDTSQAARRLGQILSSGTYVCYRTALKFDTSSIPAASIIDRTRMRLTAQDDGQSRSTTNFDVSIRKVNWASQDPVSAANRDTVYDNILSATQDAVWRSTNGMSLDTVYTSPDLDTTWVNKGGTTYYGVASSRDVNNTTPSGNEWIVLYLQVATNADFRPRLIVDYTLPIQGTAVIQTGGSAVPLAVSYRVFASSVPRTTFISNDEE